MTYVTDLKKQIKLARQKGIEAWVRGEPGYPEELDILHDAPEVLFYRGEWKTGEKRIAVVGTRRASRAGTLSAKYFSEELALAGVSIVSGLARGIDTAAHEACLKAGGRTIAVLGSGLLNIYPAENHKLADRIVEQGGLVMSEFALKAEPEPFHFPLRNRIISALSAGVLVVEAPKKSGALITADHAMEQGKEVFIVPGSVHSREAEGSNSFIKQGAACVTEPNDILFALGWKARPEPARRGARPQISDPVLLHLSVDEPIDVEELAVRSGSDVSGVLARLAAGEARGLVKRLASGGYVLSEGGTHAHSR